MEYKCDLCKQNFSYPPAEINGKKLCGNCYMHKVELCANCRKPFLKSKLYYNSYVGNYYCKNCALESVKHMNRQITNTISWLNDFE